MGDIDFNEIARKIKALPGLVKPGDMCRLALALDGIRDLPFPPGYLDALRGDMISALRSGPATSAYVYLSFYGSVDSASHLKIGIAKNVKSRMSGIKTGNPLLRLWTYAAQFPAREMALAVETFLLSHVSRDSVHGEWVNVHGMSEQAALAFVESLAEVAGAVGGRRVEFELQGGMR
jgi:T5orf172 domain-containing protein